MGQVINYRISRGPNFALSIRGSANGWNLLHSTQNAQAVTSSPAGLLLNPAQVQAIPPLAAIKGKAPVGAGLFDPLYDTLSQAFAAQDFTAMDKTASEFLKQHPIASTQSLGATERHARRFFL